MVAADIARQIAGGSNSVCGLMLESHLVEGRQDSVNGRQGLVYGQSVTDACIGWDATVAAPEPARKAARLLEIDWNLTTTGKQIDQLTVFNYCLFGRVVTLMFEP